MNIPEHLHPFHGPTLIAVTDNVQAKLYLANEREINLVHTISTKSVPEAHDDTRSAEPAERHQTAGREELYQRLSEDLLARLRNGEFEALAVTVPQENMNELKETLHVELLKAADAWVGKLLTNDDVIDIVQHVQEEG